MRHFYNFSIIGEGEKSRRFCIWGNFSLIFLRVSGTEVMANICIKANLLLHFAGGPGLPDWHSSEATRRALGWGSREILTRGNTAESQESDDGVAK